jgi:hypothetical protein
MKNILSQPDPVVRCSLQIAVFIGALVPVVVGLAGIVLGPGMVDGNSTSTMSMDSHYRYLSGLLAGIGFGFWTTVSGIENKTSRFRLLTAIVVVGGLGRLYSLIAMGVPEPSMLFGLTMELVITPLLALWQRAVARQASHK